MPDPHNDDKADSSSDDDAASQTTEDDPQVPDPPPTTTNPVSKPQSRDRPHYRLKHVLQGHSKSISSVKFSPDGTLLASSSASTEVKIWSPVTGKLVKNLTGHTAGLSDVSWSYDSVHLASASDDTTIRIWEVDTVCLSPPFPIIYFFQNPRV